jgi:hypothetical protein
MTSLGDRRQRRSLDPLIALHYQLAQTRRESQLEAIVLADDSGLVVAGAGTWAVCEELAAYAPLLWQRTRSCFGPNSRGCVADGSHKVDVHPVDLEGQTVLLCAIGGGPRVAAMQRAAVGVTRILRTSS